MTKRPWLVGLAALCIFSGWVPAAFAQKKAIGPYPTVSLRDIPQPLQELYISYRPDMTQYSRCAAAFDGHTDGEKMAFRCSIYIKMSAEGERRAMRYCEEKRVEQKISAPCRIIVEP
ncbi:MAG: hypothetical protein RLZZ24_1062 [Pseudomonadota bacterium]